MKLEVTNLIKKKNKYEVTFSNDEVLFASENLVLKHRLVKGHEVEISSYEKIRKEALYFDYYDKALAYLSRGLKSKYKIYLYLIEKECKEEYACKIIDELENRKILNDQKYADMLANHYLNKGYGPIYIKNRAYSEKIKKEFIEESLSNIQYDEFLNEAKRLVKKRMINYKKYNQFELKMKLKNYLLTRGFDSYMISLAIEGGLNEEE